MAEPDDVKLELALRGNVLTFDGANDSVDMGDPGISENTAFTVELICRVPKGTALKSTPTVYSEGTPASWGNNLFVIFFGDDSVADNEVRVWQKDSGGAGGTILVGGLGLNDGQWHHIAVVQANLSSRILYVNGVSVDTNTTTLLAMVMTDAYLGANDNNGTLGQYSIAGLEIREIRLWNDERTSAEILANMWTELVGNEAGLQNYWRVRDGTGNIGATTGGITGIVAGATWNTRVGPIWTDVTEDAMVQNDIVMLAGVLSSLPTERMAGIGTLGFYLNNSEGNAAGLLGYYMPGHANALSGFELGIDVRLRFQSSSTWYYKYVGKLRKLTPKTGSQRERYVDCEAADFIDEMSIHKMDLLAVQTDRRSDLLFGDVIGNMADAPPGANYIAGQEVFAYGADGLKDEKSTALAAAKRIVMSEFGYGYVAGDTKRGGVLTYEDRHTRVKNQTVIATISNVMSEMEVERSNKNIFNKVRAVSYPREVGVSNEVLYTLQRVISINANNTETFIGRYKDPSNRDSRISGNTMVTPVVDTDYKFGSSEGGGSNDMNADLGVTVTFGANSAKIVLANNGSSVGYVNLFQLRGLAIRTYEAATALAEDSNSQDNYGVRDLPIVLQYQDNPLVAQDWADSILSGWKDPITLVKSVTFWANRSDALLAAALSVEIGNRVTLTESVSAISSADYVVNGIQLWLKGKSKNLMVKWYLAPASTEAYWLLGTTGASELGQTTALGF
jgi:hypothetical protein